MVNTFAEKSRCDWCTEDALYTIYHDKEWGVPQYDALKLFEFLILEGAQAGLSWITILQKREHYQDAFHGYDPEVMASFNEEAIEILMKNPGVIRNRLKLHGAVTNAKCFLEVERNHPGGFSAFIWNHVNGKPLQNCWTEGSEIPVETQESRCMAKNLKKKGFKFVGPVICYAYMQACGLVNDHLQQCYRYAECKSGP